MTGYEWHDLVGNIGVLCILGSYLLLQLQKVASDSLAYLLVNASGALLVLLSLAFEFNLSAFLIEFTWLFISIYGLVRRSMKPA